MKGVIIKGIYVGLLVAGCRVIGELLGESTTLMLLSYAVLFLGLYWFSAKHRDNDLLWRITYVQAFKYAMGLNLVAAIVVGIVGALANVFYPNLFANTIDKIVALCSIVAWGDGLQDLRKVGDVLGASAAFFTYSVITHLLLGTAIAIVSSAMVKKEPEELAYYSRKIAKPVDCDVPKAEEWESDEFSVDALENEEWQEPNEEELLSTKKEKRESTLPTSALIFGVLWIASGLFFALNSDYGLTPLLLILFGFLPFIRHFIRSNKSIDSNTTAEVEPEFDFLKGNILHVDYASSEEGDANVELRKVELHISSMPENADVFINDKDYLGKTPLIVHVVKNSSVRLMARRSFRYAKEVEISVKEESLEIYFDFLVDVVGEDILVSSVNMIDEQQEA